MTISRRNLLKSAAGIATGATLPRHLLAQNALNTTTIPSSGQQIPSVGMGCRNYRGSMDSGEMTAFRETFAAFHKGGGKVIDTSPNYGNSEEIIGHIMNEQDIRDDLWLATKVDREDAASGIERIENSFDLLGGESFELMQVHNLRGVDIQLRTMRELKEQGRLRYIGVTTSNDRQYEEMESVLAEHQLDFVQVDYSLGNRNASNRLLPLAQDRGIAVLVNLPFGRGRLFNAVGDRPLPDWAADIDATSWAQVFLKYVMSHSSGAIPIPGTTKPYHAEDNLNAARGRLPDATLRAEMEAFIDPLL
ncbi:MAG: aldo/keto reductase [Gammaproteobacteria bacterium]|jgi:diketogulonate reductase-like aldo/keto reductase|nr:aldo/keto reductase [Gammaproteobacteria bacterium]MDG2249920.1 aldo/keto reductase [Gammaproteobacteria bacterium]